MLSERQLAAITKLQGDKKVVIKTATQAMSERPVARSISTGLVGLDRIIGRIGGIPRGKWTHIYGEESVGKSTLTYHIIAQAQSQGLSVFLADIEATFDPEYARALGIDLDALFFIHMGAEDGGEELVDRVERIVRSGSADVVVIDSVGAMVPGKMFENEVGKSMPGRRAALVSEMLARLTGPMARTNTAIVLVNQMTGTMQRDFHGNELLTPKGGRALRHYSSLNLLIKRKRKPNEDSEGEAVSSDVTIRIDKNKVGLPFGVAELKVEFGKGFDAVSDLTTTALEFGIVVKAGAWLNYGEFKAQGAERFVALLRQDTVVLPRLYAETLEACKAEGERKFQEALEARKASQAVFA